MSELVNEGPCDWCGKTCRLRRCTRCSNASFCSRECQRADWNDREKGHRNACDVAYSSRRAGEREVTEAELRQLLSEKLANMPLSEAQNEYYKTMNAIESLEKTIEEEKKEGKTKIDESSRSKRAPAIGAAKRNNTSAAGTSADNQNRPAATKQSNPSKRRTQPSVFDHIGQQWQCCVERLPHVSCYSTTLTRTDNCTPEECASLSDRLHLSIGAADNAKDLDLQHSTIVRVHAIADDNENENDSDAIIVSLTLPDPILPNAPGLRLSVDDTDGSITMRLPYGETEANRSKSHDVITASQERWANMYDGENIISASYSISDPQDLARLACRSCGHCLLANNKKISKVLPLPIGCWDEVADYLTCYEGQPALDFGPNSTVADRGMILEDGSVVDLNRADLGQNVCVLAVDGYGELAEEKSNGSASNEPSLSGLADLDTLKNGAEYRGLRKWRDSVGGATLCCSQCCATLGFASLDNPDACRLFKHRLSTFTPTESQGLAKDIFSKNTCAAFIAKDMIRYAESQAVFTFVLTAGRGDGVDQSSPQECILLKLLSWDTVFATSSYYGEERVSTSLGKGIKVIYEFVDEIMGASDIPDSVNAKSIDDIMTWTWGGADLCCPPFASGNTRKHEQDTEAPRTTPEYGNASVQIFLTEEEMSQVKNDIRAGSSFFSESVSKATTLLKLGEAGNEGTRSNKGLSVISIV